jgi:hypothetical protein
MDFSNITAFELQPFLENELVRIESLKKEDFELLIEKVLLSNIQ